MFRHRVITTLPQAEAGTAPVALDCVSDPFKRSPIVKACLAQSFGRHVASEHWVRERRKSIAFIAESGMQRFRMCVRLKQRHDWKEREDECGGGKHECGFC